MFHPYDSPYVSPCVSDMFFTHAPLTHGWRKTFCVSDGERLEYFVTHAQLRERTKFTHAPLDADAAVPPFVTHVFQKGFARFFTVFHL
jgi:hypothetical protein